MGEADEAGVLSLLRVLYASVLILTGAGLWTDWNSPYLPLGAILFAYLGVGGGAAALLRAAGRALDRRSGGAPFRWRSAAGLRTLAAAAMLAGAIHGGVYLLTRGANSRGALEKLAAMTAPFFFAGIGLALLALLTGLWLKGRR